MAITIGIDGNCWINPRGYGRFTRELVRALLEIDRYNRYVLFLDQPTAAQAHDLPVHTHVRIVTVPTRAAAAAAASAWGHRSLRDLWAMRRAVARWNGRMDVFFFPSVYTFFPIRTRARVVVTIHDTLPEHLTDLVFPHRRARWFWKWKVAWAIRCADVVAAVSWTSRYDLMRRWNLAETQTVVIPDGVSAVFQPVTDPQRLTAGKRRYGIPLDVPYFLYVGGLNPHKNITGLLRAFAGIALRFPNVHLVLVGPHDRDVFYAQTLPFPRSGQENAWTARVIRAGFVSDADLACLYSGAVACVMPSYGEGFGLPAVESMACGTPVIASRAGALPEVVRDAGLYFDPYRPDELAMCMERLLLQPDLRRVLGRRGIHRARAYTWTQSAQCALEVFARLASGVEQVCGSVW